VKQRQQRVESLCTEHHDIVKRGRSLRLADRGIVEEMKTPPRLFGAFVTALGLLASTATPVSASQTGHRTLVPVVVCHTSLGVKRALPTLATSARVWVPAGWAGRVALYRDALGRQVGQLAPARLRCQAIDFADGRSVIQVLGTTTLGGFHGFSSALLGPCRDCLVADLWPFLNAAQHQRYASLAPPLVPGMGVSHVQFLARSADSRSGTVLYEQATEAMMGPQPFVAINYNLATASAEQETCAESTSTRSFCTALLEHWNEYYPYRSA